MQRSFGPARIFKYAALAFIAQDLAKRGYRRYRKAQESKEDQKKSDMVDVNVEDSFPASDPPSYTRTTAGSTH